ncbi:acyl-CoA dehydrogenase family protein [Gallaecimonas sp. GXIMD1310]|uniref:acyl-CoA dehydrogenase family protein n=1 Tax=Gallaecimonas sp. GXIMD1310 TaxID=3131926 RepID=UPI00324CA6E2
MAPTHQVSNQSPALLDYDPVRLDLALQDALAANGGQALLAPLRQYGRWSGSAEAIALGFAANAHPPQLDTHDRYGHRLDMVHYHPSYHQLMAQALSSGLHASPWQDGGSQLLRAAQYYLHAQVEPGHGCPVTMTFAAAPVLRRYKPDWFAKLLHYQYDPSNQPVGAKQGLTLGMGMTEKQGGSDVRVNQTQAQCQADGSYELIGHKWFLSAPMSDGFLMLAQAEGGLSCFLVPRWWQGAKNPLELQRLKNKLGNRANASSEVELRGAQAWRLGDEGQGVRTIIDMVALTRFDCMLGSSASQRQAVLQAVHHARHRKAFGAHLSEQPLMAAVLADLQLEVEGSLAMSLRLARALDKPEDEHEQLLVRLGTAVGKYWICKRTPQHAYEAMECLGGNGVMEEFITARLYREAPINAIWEGSGNIQALDVLRVLTKTPQALAVWQAELTTALSDEPLLASAWQQLQQLLAKPLVAQARHITELLALTLQGALLLRQGPEEVARAFIQSRLAGRSLHYGTLPARTDVALLLHRACPEV